MAQILITGATGKIGREVAAQLAGRDGVTARAASRSARGVAGLPGVAFDWHDRTTWAAAVEGVDALFLLRPDLRDAPSLIADLLAAAPSVRRVVLVSEIGAVTAAPEAWEARVEHAVTSAAREWTLVRPTWFMQTLTDPAFFADGIRERGELELPTGGAEISLVDTRDIAAVAAAALLEDGHAGAAYELTGPERWTFAAVAELLAQAVGRPVRYVDAPAAGYLATFDDAFDVEGFSRAFDRMADGTDARVSDAVERVTGRPARGLRDFVAEHAGVWKR